MENYGLYTVSLDHEKFKNKPGIDKIHYVMISVPPSWQNSPTLDQTTLLFSFLTHYNSLI